MTADNKALPISNATIKSGKKSRLFTMLVILSMLGYSYVLPFFTSVTLGECFLILACVVLLFRTKKLYMTVPLRLILFFVYGIIISLICALAFKSYEAVAVRLLRDAVYWIILLVFGRTFFDFQYFVKGVKVFCLALSLFIVLQVGVYYLTGYLVPGLLPSGMVSDTVNGQDVYDHILFWVGHAGYLKPNGFLSEAAHCAQCLFIGALVVLFDGRKIKEHYGKLVTILLFMGASVLTFSASAVIYCAFVGVLLLIEIVKEKDAKSLLAIIVVIILGVVVLFNMGISSIVDRVLNVLTGGGGDGSAFTRIFKGFIYWGELPLVHQIFGIGFGNVSVATENFFIVMEGAENEFMSTLSYLLVSTGAVGFIIILSFFVKLFKGVNKAGKLMIIGLLIMSLAASVYSSPYWTWMMFYIMNNKKERRVDGK